MSLAQLHERSGGFIFMITFERLFSDLVGTIRSIHARLLKEILCQLMGGNSSKKHLQRYSPVEWSKKQATACVPSLCLFFIQKKLIERYVIHICTNWKGFFSRDICRNLVCALLVKSTSTWYDHLLPSKEELRVVFFFLFLHK